MTIVHLVQMAVVNVVDVIVVLDRYMAAVATMFVLMFGVCLTRHFYGSRG